MTGWRSPLLTLLALVAAGLAWVAGGAVAAAVSPGGAELLLRALFVFLALGPFDRLLARLPPEEPPHE